MIIKIKLRKLILQCLVGLKLLALSYFTLLLGIFLLNYQLNKSSFLFTNSLVKCFASMLLSDEES